MKIMGIYLVYAKRVWPKDEVGEWELVGFSRYCNEDPPCLKNYLGWDFLRKYQYVPCSENSETE